MAKGRSSKAREEESEEEAEEFEVRAIIRHRGTADRGLSYEVAWVGYPSESDNTWQDEESTQTAKEAVDEYWRQFPLSKQLIRYKSGSAKHKALLAKIDKEKEKDSSAKKRNGTSSASGSKKRGQSPELGSPAAKKKKAAPEPEEEEEEDADAEDPDKDDEQLNQYDVEGRSYEAKHETPALLKKQDWESVVYKIETVERSSNDELKFLVIWKGDKTFAWIKAADARFKCPQKVIDFYESHLKFRVKDGDEDEL